MDLNKSSACSGLYAADIFHISWRLQYNRYKENLPFHRIACLVINRKQPSTESAKDALNNSFKGFGKRWSIVLNAGNIKVCNLKNGKGICYQVIGMEDTEAEEIIRLSSTYSDMPEPLRVAHLIGTALVKRENSGRA